MTGEAKVQIRNATVIAKAEGDEGVDTMMMTREGLEKLLEADTQIDVKALYCCCAKRSTRCESR